MPFRLLLLPPLPTFVPEEEQHPSSSPPHTTNFDTITAWALAFAQELDGFAAYHPRPEPWYMLHSSDGRARLRLRLCRGAVEATILATGASQLVTTFGELRSLLARAAADYTGVVRGLPSPTSTSLLSLRQKRTVAPPSVVVEPNLKRSLTSVAALWRRFSITPTPSSSSSRAPRRALSSSSA